MRSWTGEMVSLSALPGPSGSGSSSVSPWNSTRSRASAMRTTATYSRVRCSCLAKRCPCQPSATCGPEEPMPRIMRPLESWSIVAAVIAVIAGERPGIWKMPEPRRILRGLPGEPAEHGGGVGAVGLRGPDRVVAEPLGLLHDGELVLRGEAQAPVADVHAELHVQVSFQREGIRCGRREGVPRLGRALSAGMESVRAVHSLCEIAAARAAQLSACALRSTACRWHAGSDARGVGERADHRRRLRRREGGVCPMLAPPRGGRTDFLAFASPGIASRAPAARSAGERARAAHPRGPTRGSLMSASALTGMSSKGIRSCAAPRRTRRRTRRIRRGDRARACARRCGAVGAV